MTIEEKPVETAKRPGKKANQEKPVNLEQMILERLRTLSYAKQQEVLDFVEFLQQKTKDTIPFKSSKGTLAHLNIDVDEEDFAEVSRELSQNFPRDISL